MRLNLQILRTLLLTALGAAGLLRAAPAPVGPDQFLPTIAHQLAVHFGTAGELQLTLLRAWKPVPVAAENWEMTVVAPPASLAPQMIIPVRLVAAGRTLGEWNLPLQARLWDDALVARQPVLRDEALSLSLFEPRRHDFLRDKDAVPATADLSGLAVARGVAAGAVLSWRDVARRTLVQRGSRVEVLAVHGALTITMKGLAMQSGALGETITVRNPESRRDFSAVVTAENQARVTY